MGESLSCGFCDSECNEPFARENWRHNCTSVWNMGKTQILLRYVSFASLNCTEN